MVAEFRAPAGYRFLGIIGRGGMSEVGVAVRSGPAGFERPVVLKRLLPHIAAQPNHVAMFLDEARILARIRHRNVVHVLGLEEVDGSYVLAMEYLEGEPGSEISRRRSQGTALPPHLAAFIVAEAAAGLHAAHELRDVTGESLRVVHRDVSPHNVLVTYAGDVKVLDFGIALADGREALTTTGEFKGKLAYAAPEQLAGQPADPQTDVFSLGLVLHELLTGRRVFEGDNALQVLDRVANGPIPAPSALSPGVPRALDEIASRAVERDRHLRFVTAADLRTALLGEVHKELGGDPEIALSRWMETVFASERAEKRVLLRTLRRFSDATTPMTPEASLSSELLRVHDRPHPASLGMPTVLDPVLVPSRRASGDPGRGGRRTAQVAIAVAAIVVCGAIVAAFASWTSSTAAVADAAQPPSMPMERTGASDAPPALHQLRVATRPPGAQVAVDGQLRCLSPCTIDVPSGTAVALALSREGHRPYSESIVLAADRDLEVMLVAEEPPTVAVEMDAGLPIRDHAIRDAGARPRRARRDAGRFWVFE